MSAAAASASSSSAAATMTATPVAAVGAPPAPPPPPPQPDQKPAHDVVAGAMARAASQSTIHPLDTMKVRMQAGRAASSSSGAGGGAKPSAQASLPPRGKAPLERQLLEVRGLYKVRGCWSAGSGWRQCGLQHCAANSNHDLLRAVCCHPGQPLHACQLGCTLPAWQAPYKLGAACLLLLQGVVGAATGAGIIIGTYFAFYSTTKRFLRERTDMNDGATAFTAGAAAALGSSVVKVPLAVCIRSVQAGIYRNVFHAASSIVKAAGVRGLFTVGAAGSLGLP